MAIIEIRSAANDWCAPIWWQRFCNAMASSRQASRNDELCRIIKKEYHLRAIQFFPNDPNSSAKSLEGDEKDITMFLLKWS